MRTSAAASIHLGSEEQAQNTEMTAPMMSQRHFIDAKVQITNPKLQVGVSTLMFEC